MAEDYVKDAEEILRRLLAKRRLFLKNLGNSQYETTAEACAGLNVYQSVIKTVQEIIEDERKRPPELSPEDEAQRKRDLAAAKQRPRGGIV